MKLSKLPLLARVAIAIVLGLAFGYIFPEWLSRIFVTFNSFFSQFLGFCIPLIILGLVAPGIADLGNNAGKLLLFTVGIAYGSTLFSGFMTYFSCEAVFPLIDVGTQNTGGAIVNPAEAMLNSYFVIEIPPLFDVMTALVLAFVLGLGGTVSKNGGATIKSLLTDLKEIVEIVISRVIIPLLPLYIFGMFLNMSTSGSAFSIISTFGKVIGVIFVLHILLPLIQYFVAGSIVKKNPFKLLWTMMPAYATALGTSSSAATIPVTLRQTLKNGVNEDVAGFCVPLCCTIHLAGSTLKITATALAVCMITGYPHDLATFAGFICMLGIIMIAAPGVPGGAIMAAIGPLQSILGFGEADVALMIAVYIAIDSFGTACNVVGDGAIALVLDKIYKKPNTDVSTELTFQNQP
ncbi:dicarboxylate/amino acid:cation symporter [Massilibacteroides vaginae]|uniref:dicarboxylate/amino acid:cation symporter n=1 Tax=Massilibacteroides vaginae TaxID=1673718 RepID=UPI000A1C8B14|nr:dicarboxylate/amino acid:cation symporter [Massilibacteroides vaginae]